MFNMAVWMTRKWKVFYGNHFPSGVTIGVFNKKTELLESDIRQTRSLKGDREKGINFFLQYTCHILINNFRNLHG